VDIKHLTHIVALADKKNFARAAEQLNLSQPALTRSIQSAEADVGLKLFDRGSTEVVPTPAGQFLLERARQLVFDNRCLKRDMDLYRDAKMGDTSFGVAPLPASTYMTPLLVGLRQTHPNINFKVMVGHWGLQLKFLRDESIEFFLGLITDLPRDADLQVRSLYREEGGFFARRGHPLLAQDAVTLTEIWDYGVASVRLPDFILAMLSGFPGLQRNVSVECDNLGTLKAIALQTDTVLAGVPRMVPRELADGSLVPLKLAAPLDLGVEMGIVTLRGRTPSPMANLVLQRLVELAAAPDLS
jgi:DNA-binding transcriptional LysR family regulator